MNLQISQWGNSLALRISSDIARRFDWHHGDTVDARITVDGALSIRPLSCSRAAFASEVDSARESMPVGASVIDELRGNARY